MIEMAALANATGLELSKRGMYGPEATIKTLHSVYSLKKDGGVLDRAGVIDYCTGDVAPGVFVIVRTDAPYINDELKYLNLGTGPYFALYRPFHLASVEAPLSLARAVLDREASLYSPSLKAEVATMAKKVTVDIELLEDLSTVTDILFNIVIKKKLNNKEIERMRYVNKLLLTATELLSKTLEK
jgi:predicted homoserine dehydrogenase-like protein